MSTLLAVLKAAQEYVDSREVRLAAMHGKIDGNRQCWAREWKKEQAAHKALLSAVADLERQP